MAMNNNTANILADNAFYGPEQMLLAQASNPNLQYNGINGAIQPGAFSGSINTNGNEDSKRSNGNIINVHQHFN